MAMINSTITIAKAAVYAVAVVLRNAPSSWRTVASALKAITMAPSTHGVAAASVTKGTSVEMATPLEHKLFWVGLSHGIPKVGVRSMLCATSTKEEAMDLFFEEYLSGWVIKDHSAFATKGLAEKDFSQTLMDWLMDPFSHIQAPPIDETVDEIAEKKHETGRCEHAMEAVSFLKERHLTGQIPQGMEPSDIFATKEPRAGTRVTQNGLAIPWRITDYGAVDVEPYCRHDQLQFAAHEIEMNQELSLFYAQDAFDRLIICELGAIDVSLHGIIQTITCCPGLGAIISDVSETIQALLPGKRASLLNEFTKIWAPIVKQINGTVANASVQHTSFEAQNAWRRVVGQHALSVPSGLPSSTFIRHTHSRKLRELQRQGWHLGVKEFRIFAGEERPRLQDIDVERLVERIQIQRRDRTECQTRRRQDDPQVGIDEYHRVLSAFQSGPQGLRLSHAQYLE